MPVRRRLSPGHSITLWAFDGTFASGWVAGGLVGGNGEISFSTNNCIYVTTGQFDEFLGREPGGDRRCDEMNLSATFPEFLPPGLMLFLLDHGEWTPGDMQAIWTWEDIVVFNTGAWFMLE